MKIPAFVICILFLHFFLCCDTKSIDDVKCLYTVDLSNINNIIESDFSTKITKTIILESKSESLFGNISKICIGTNRIYVFDPFRTKELMVFDFDGKFIHSFYNIGRGPNEVALPKDFIIDKNDNIHIYDQIGYMVKVYDSKRKLKGSYSLGCPMKSISILPSGNYIGYIGNISNNYINNTLITSNVIYFDESNEFYNQIYALAEDITYYHLGGGLFQNYNGETLLRTPGDCCIYKVIKDKIDPFCYIELGENALPPKLIEKYRDTYLEFFNRIVKETKYIYHFNKFLDLQDYLYLGYLYRGKSYCCVIRKSDQRIVFNSTLVDFSQICAGQAKGIVIGGTKDELILSVQAIDIEGDLKNDSNTSQRIGKDDNPVLFFIKLN